jgi:hypothetical protein
MKSGDFPFGESPFFPQSIQKAQPKGPLIPQFPAEEQLDRTKEEPNLQLKNGS